MESPSEVVYCSRLCMLLVEGKDCRACGECALPKDMHPGDLCDFCGNNCAECGASTRFEWYSLGLEPGDVAYPLCQACSGGDGYRRLRLRRLRDAT